MKPLWSKMTKEDPLQTHLAQLAVLKAELDRLAEVKQQYDLLKLKILEEMREAKSRRTEAYAGVYAVRAERQDVRVVEPEKVEAWLVANRFKLDEYKRLDLTRVTPLVRVALKETGEIVPGTTLERTEYVTLREAKQ